MKTLLLTPQLKKFKNGEFSKYIRTVKDLSSKHDLEGMQLTEHSNTLNNTYKNFKKAYKKNRGSTLTSELALMDRYRDNGLKLLQRSVKLIADFAREEQDRHLANLIYKTITKHGKRIYNMPYGQQGGIMDEIIEEIEDSAELGAAIDALHLRKYFNEMKEAHQAFDKVYKARLEELQEIQNIPTVSKTRKRTTTALKTLFSWIFINTKSSGNMELFETYIGQLNALTIQYNTAVNRRLKGNTDADPELDDGFDPDREHNQFQKI